MMSLKSILKNKNIAPRRPVISLTQKTILLFVLISVIPLSISSFYSYRNTIKVLQAEYVNSNDKIIQLGSQNISNYMEYMNQMTLSLYKDSQFIYDLTPDQNDFLSNSYNEKFLKAILFSRDEIEYLYYYVPTNNSLYSFSKQMTAKNIFPEIEEENWYKNTLSSNNGLYIEAVHEFKNYNHIGISNSSDVVSFNRRIKDIGSGKLLGMLSIVVSSKWLENFCKSIQNEGEFIFLVDDSGSILYSTNDNDKLILEIADCGSKGKQDSGSYSVTAEDNLYSVVFSETYNGLTLFKAIHYSFLQEVARNSVKTNVLIAFITLFAVIAISITSSLAISLPMKRLIKSMKKLGEGNFDVFIEHYRNDEIGILSDKFNIMAREINQLINSEYKAKLAKKNAQLRALQAQINPHFVNNALQSMGTLALMKNAPEVYEMAKSLASMLRYSIRFSNEMVTLETEIENTNNYLYIQKIRFRDSLEVIYDIDDSLMQIMVPKLILQPIVENSIKYGIERDIIKEVIKITVKQDDENITLTVEDNGLGMDEEKAGVVQDWLTEDADPLSMSDYSGIKSVSIRLSLLYNKRAKIYFNSKQGEGTLITIKIPDITKEGEFDVQSDCDR